MTEDPILDRRVATKSEKVKTGLFSSEDRLVLEEPLREGETLWCVGRGPDGTVLSVAPCADPAGSPTGAELHAVFASPRKVAWSIDLGKDAKGHTWWLDLRGEVRVADPVAFLSDPDWRFADRATSGSPFAVSGLLVLLGDVPKDIVLNMIKRDAIGLMKLSDEVDGVPFDMAGWVEERSLTCAAFAAALAEHPGTPFRAEGGSLAILVNERRFRSPEREEAARIELENEKKRLEGPGPAAAYSAFERLANEFSGKADSALVGSLSELLGASGRKETGLRLLALAKDRRRADAGLSLRKNKPSVDTRSPFSTTKTPALHYGESISSTIESGRAPGYLTVLNVTESDEIVPLLPNEDFPSVRLGRGERVTIGDADSPWIPEIREDATSGTDHFVAFLTDEPLLDAPLPPLGESLSAEAAARLVARIESLREDEWSADALSFSILPPVIR